jgi:MFS family permease
LRRLVLLVSAIVLLDTAFYSAVAPLLPHYVDELGLTKSEAGILTGSFAAGSLAGAVPAGWLTGRIGVKRTMLAGLALLAVASLVFGFAREAWLLDTARFAQGLSSACTWTAGFTWVVERAPADRRGEAIGTPLAAAIAGALVGPVLGAAADSAGPEPVFAGVAVAAVLLALPALRQPAQPGTAADMRRVAAAMRAPGIRLGIWLVAVPALAAGVLNVLVPLRLDALGATGFAIGAAYLVAAGLEAALSPVVGRISDRRGRLLPIRAGLLGIAVLLVLLPLPGSALAVALLFMATALAGGAFWAPAMAMLSDEVERARVQQGFAFAFTNIAWASGQLVGNGGGSALAQATDDWVSYTLVALLCLATLAGVSVGRRGSGASSS